MLISFEMLYFQILLESIGRQVEDVASDWAGRLKTLLNATVGKADRATEPPLDDDQSSPPLKPRTEEQGANKGRRQERENSSPLSLYRWYSSLSLKLSWLQTSHRTVVDNILLFRYLWSALENIAEEASSSTSFHHRLLFQFAFHLHRPLQTSDSAWDARISSCIAIQLFRIPSPSAPSVSSLKFVSYRKSDSLRSISIGYPNNKRTFQWIALTKTNILQHTFLVI